MGISIQYKLIIDSSCEILLKAHCAFLKIKKTKTKNSKTKQYTAFYLNQFS